LKTARKDFLNGTVVYFIGSALTQVMSLVLLRFVTGKISADEYGFYNLIVTVDNLITPIFTLQIGDALFRYFIKAEDGEEKKRLYTNAMLIVYIGGFIMAAGFIVFHLINPINHIFWVIVYMLSTNLYNLYSKIIRSMGKNKAFATLGFVKTMIYLVLQMVLLFGFGLGGETLFISVSVSTFIAIFAIEIFIRPHKYFSFKHTSLSTVKYMVRFSGPLIPNTLLWWLCSSVNSIIVTARLGLDINGIYAVSNKFSNILIMVTHVFSMAWQESAIKEYDKEDFKKFQTETFNSYIVMVLSGVAMLIPFVNLVMPHMIDESYHSAIQYVPFLLIATGFSTFSGYAAQILSAKEKSKSVMVSSIFGMIANVICVVAMVNFFGLWSAVWGTLISNVILTVVRIFLVRDSFDKGVWFFRIFVISALIAIDTVVFMKCDWVVNLVCFAITVLVSLILNKELLRDLLSVLFAKFKRKGAANE